MKKYLCWLGIFACILSFLISVPSGSANSNWEYVCSGGNDIKYYLDISRVEKQDQYLRFWRKGVRMEIKDGEKEFVSQHEVHLANPLEIRVLHIISYDENGNELRNYDKAREWQPLRSGSVMYALANAAMHYVK